MGMLVKVRLKSLTGLAVNDTVNSFAFNGADSPAARANLADLVAKFYNEVHAPSTEPVAAFLSNFVSRAALASQIDIYDLEGHLDGSPHGSPTGLFSFTLGPIHAGYDAYAEEVACCLSLHGDLSALPEEGAGLVAIPTPARAIAMGAPATHMGRTRPRSRARGRLYVGPLALGAVDTDDTNKRVRPDPNFRDVLGRAGRALITATTGIPETGGAWCVWSRRDAALHPITGCTVDDALDTQRRRGVKPTVKTAF